MSDDNMLLGKIDGKVDMILEHVRDHNTRITSLEGDRNRVKGALWGVGIGSASLGGLIAKLFPWGHG